MTNKNVQILLKITEELERKIENAIREGGYRSRQEFIRDAILSEIRRQEGEDSDTTRER